MSSGESDAIKAKDIWERRGRILSNESYVTIQGKDGNSATEYGASGFEVHEPELGCDHKVDVCPDCDQILIY